VDFVTLYTIGHGNRSSDELVSLLTAAAIRTLVDIRAYPTSKHNPQFNEPAVREAMEHAGIIYHWAGKQLGGKRPSAPDSPHIALAEGLRGFADYMQTSEFRRAASQLVNLASKAATAVLCAEQDPQHCHRSLLADYLVLQGHKVVHIIAQDDVQEHELSVCARRESAALIYDRNVTGELPL